MTREDDNPPALIDPSAGGQEPPFVGPTTANSSDSSPPPPSTNNAAPSGGSGGNSSSSENNNISSSSNNTNTNASNQTATTPPTTNRRRVQLGRINITSSGGRIHINASGGGRSQRNAASSNTTAGPASNSANNSGANNAQRTQQQQQQQSQPQPQRQPPRVRVHRVVHRASNPNNSAGSGSRQQSSQPQQRPHPSNTNPNNHHRPNNNATNATNNRPMPIPTFHVNAGNRQSIPMPPPPPFMMGMPSAMLPPLEPQPVPNQMTTTTTGDAASGSFGTAEAAAAAAATEEDMKGFECAICFEYMDHPVRCGAPTCETRFCRSCLHRVLRQEVSNRPPTSTDPPNSAKCPHCRSFFTLESMKCDRDLKQRIDECTDTITCPFEGCGTELRIGLLKSHEATCPYIRMRCRYAGWGCDWIGCKKDVRDHETNCCEFRGGLGNLVERVRQGDAKALHVLQQHHMQIFATSQMLSLHSRQLMMMRGRNVGDVGDVAALAYEVTLFPGRFSAMREIWSGMINQQDARCVVTNMLLLLPSLALVFHVSLQGFKMIYNVQFETISGDDLVFLIDGVLLSLITLMLGILCIVCFFIDAKSPAEWAIYNIKNFIPAQPILRDLAAVCMAMIHFSAIEFLSMHPGLLLWHCVAVPTILYTSFVSRIIEKNADSEISEAGIVTLARAWPVVIFGLRYGLLAGICGFAATVNAVALLRLCKQADSAFGLGLVSSTVTREDSECFLTLFGGSAWIAVSSLVTAYVYHQFPHEEASLLQQGFADLVCALVGLAYVNTLVYMLDRVGRRLGENNFVVGNNGFMQAHRASGAVVPNIKPTTIGCAVLGVCVFPLLCVVMG